MHQAVKRALSAPFFQFSPRDQLATALPGIAIAFTVGFAASFLSEHYGAPAMLFALLLGMALNFLYEDERSAVGINITARNILRIGVALLGFRIALSDLFGLGWQTLALVVIGVATTILFGLAAAHFAGMRKRFGVLTGGAVGICGASAALAIAAILPRDEARERDTVFVVVGVTTLSTLAMIFYPIFSAQLGLSESDAGIFIGATIHDVAQVVGAGYSVSEPAGDLATITKLMRVALLLPVVLVLSLAFRAQSDTSEARPPLLPGFLITFVVFVALNSFLTLPVQVVDSVNALSRQCLVAAIAAIGLKTNLRSILKVGLGPVLLLVGETLWLAVFALAGLWLLA